VKNENMAKNLLLVAVSGETQQNNDTNIVNLVKSMGSVDDSVFFDLCCEV